MPAPLGHSRGLTCWLAGCLFLTLVARGNRISVSRADVPATPDMAPAAPPLRPPAPPQPPSAVQRTRPSHAARAVLCRPGPPVVPP